MHNHFSYFLSILTILFFVISCSRKEEPIQPPNVIIILADDQAWGDISFHGNTNLSTPNIDSIAIQGGVMENFYVQPVCSPTRAELLTGQFFPRLGVYSTSAGGERMHLGVPTIAEVLKKQVTQQLPMANGIMARNPLTIPTHVGLMIITVSVPATGAIILVP